MANEKLFEAVVKSFSADPRIVQAKMFGSPGLKVSGKVFAVLVKDRLVVKLPNARVAALVASGDAQFFDPGMGKLMKEWASVDARARGQWLALATEARDFVLGLTAR